MRVCLITYSFYELDNRVMRYAEALAGRGDEVEVFSLCRPGEPPTSTVNKVRVFHIQRRTRDESGPVAYLLKILLFLIRASIITGFRHLRRRYDLIHAHSMPDFVVFAAWLPRLTGAKVILDIHDLLPEMYQSRFQSASDSWLFKLLLWKEKVSCKFAHHVIIANHLWAQRLIGRSVAAGKLTAVLNYPDRTIFKPRLCCPRGDRFVFIYPGSLNRHQGLDVAIRALALVHPKAPHAELHIYGDGPERAALEKMVIETGLSGRVLLRNPIPLREISEVLASANAGIVPKRSDSFGNEAFSTKILEFMSLGVPVIVSDTRVDRYYFNDSVVKFFCSGEEASLAEAMLQLILTPEVGKRLARNALEFVKEFDWEKRKTEYLDLVDSLTGKR